MFVNIFVDYSEKEYEKKAIETAEAIRKITPYTVMVTNTNRPLRDRQPEQEA